MRRFRSEALTLRTYSFGEANRIAVFLTRRIGKVRAVAYGARKSQSRFGSGLEPFSHLRISFSRKENQDLSTIHDCEILGASPFQSLTWEQNLHASYLAELMTEFSREEMENERLFRLGLAVRRVLPLALPAVLARYVEFWVLTLEGCMPPLASRLKPELARRTREFLLLQPEDLTQDQFSPAEMRKLERLAEELIEYHLEKPLKSRKVLKQLLS